MAGDTLPVVLREARDTDRRFIAHSWLRSLKGSAIAKLGKDSGRFFRGYGLTVDALLDRSRVLVACQPDDEDAIVGWAAVEPGGIPTVHYVYVKHPFRRYGVAKALLSPLKGESVAYTHETPALRRLPIPTGWVYDPYLLLIGNP